MIRASVILLIAGLTPAMAETGIASHYGYRDGQSTRLACQGMGRLETLTALTAAHRSLPCGSMVKVTNLSNGRSTVVRINDRGPFVRGRVIDLTYRAMKEIGGGGLAKVILSVVK